MTCSHGSRDKSRKWPSLLAGLALLGAAASARAEGEQPLLPETLGPMEYMLWSEHGFMRRVFDFPLTTESREKELSLRRSLLTWHQVGGYTTFAGLVATCVLGQMLLNADNPSQDLIDAKVTVAQSTIALYFATAALSLITPPPLVRRPGWSTTSTHKLLGALHFSGMILTPLLAPEFAGKSRQATIHQVSGYTTTAIFGAALLVMTF